MLQYIAAVDYLIAYFIKLKYILIKYNRKILKKEIFLTFSNLAFVDKKETRYSLYSLCLKLFREVFYYKAIKGKTVTTLLTKAKLLAVSFTAKKYLK